MACHPTYRPICRTPRVAEVGDRASERARGTPPPVTFARPRRGRVGSPALLHAYFLSP